LAKLTKINLILLHSNFWPDDDAKKHDRNRVIDIVKKRKDFFINEAIPNLFFENNLIACQHISHQLIDSALKIPSKEISATTKGMRDRLDNTHILIDQNVHIIQGEFDHVIPLKLMESKLLNLNNYTVIKNCGHMSIWEKTEQLLAIINLIVSNSTKV
jgi:pimeloyl-ACP methyl ester carboxylesterase